MTKHRTIISEIGNTPLIKLKKISELTGCDIYGKAEFLNPGQSIKDRTALKIIEEDDKDQIIIVNLSGRGDKDIFTVAEIFKERGII